MIKYFDMNESIPNLKTALRNLMRAKRKAIPTEERQKASNTICEKLLLYAETKAQISPNNGSVAVYLASSDEIDLTNFIIKSLKRNITIASPRWNGKAYELAKIKSLNKEDLNKGPMNILEPFGTETIEPKNITMWIIPGLAFSLTGGRLGYGGGWYDRLLADASNASLKIGVAHSFQIVDDIPVEEHDIRLNKIVTDSQLP